MTLKGWSTQLKVGAALAVAGLLLPATFAAAAPSTAKRPPAVAFSFDRSFTPAQADPRLVAALSNRPIASSEFKFTPTAAKKRSAQVRVAIRAQAVDPRVDASRNSDRRVAVASAAAVAAALTPATYNLGAAVGWRRFAVDGDVAKVRANTFGVGAREGALVGVNYNLSRRLTGRVAASADRTDNRVPALADTRAYAVDLGGAFDISRRLSVTGGVRYRVERERLAAASDQRRDSQAVYVGTALKF